MPVLEPSEYNQYYFDGANHSLSHNAGYTKYERWRRNDPGRFPEDTGEFFSDVASALRGRFNSRCLRLPASRLVKEKRRDLSALENILR
jgi:hypothetical protein